ncbi:MAG TPA: malto-oligosyltrehalose trehalohydrolase, partial [Longimicrobiales bacterium]
KPAVGSRKYPAGAEVQQEGVHFRVWAPSSSAVQLQLDVDRIALDQDADGYWSGFVHGAGPGTRYRYLLDQRGPFPDPASRFQPEGPHGPSEVIDPDSFQWTDGAWRGVERTGQIIYELHIGTFTSEGTWQAAAEHLAELAALGITMLEVMPVAEFAGRFGWGYDGVDLYAPTRLYGRPDDMRGFINRAHELGLAVILDVVYNHVGPDGNYLPEYSADYFTRRYRNEWGEPINFDGANAGPVRDFFASNAAYWIDEFHMDGLRLDATQQIFDAGPRHIVLELVERARSAARGRPIYITAENEPQDTRYLRAARAGGYEVDALWNDDFHHSAVVAATGRSEAYYSDHRGTPQELLSAVKYGFLFQGQYYAWQQQPRGTSAEGTTPERYVQFLENHDQVSNSVSGARLYQQTSPGRWRALSALLLLSPQTPLLFQGQEFAASQPFVFFADHKPGLAEAVRKGRFEFLAQFPSVAAARDRLLDPHDPATFERCKLDRAERARHGEALALHRDLIALRKSDAVFAQAASCRIDGAILGNAAFLIRYFDPPGDRLLIINLGASLHFESIAEPLMAAPRPNEWRLLWSSEDPRYGGPGSAPVQREGAWWIPAESTTVMAASRS